eukprot:276196-Alexandrium_andersonii.AAC.1
MARPVFAKASPSTQAACIELRHSSILTWSAWNSRRASSLASSPFRARAPELPFLAGRGLGLT